MLYSAGVNEQAGPATTGPAAEPGRSRRSTSITTRPTSRPTRGPCWPTSGRAARSPAATPTAGSGWSPGTRTSSRSPTTTPRSRRPRRSSSRRRRTPPRSRSRSRWTRRSSSSTARSCSRCSRRRRSSGSAPVIEYYANHCIDEFIERGEVDVVHDFADPVPVMVTLHKLGLPIDDWRRYAEPMHKTVFLRQDNPARARRARAAGMDRRHDQGGDPAAQGVAARRHDHATSSTRGRSASRCPTTPCRRW